MNKNILYPLTQNFLDVTRRLSFVHNKTSVLDSKALDNLLKEYSDYSLNHAKNISNNIYYEIENSRISETSISRILDDLKNRLGWFQHFSEINRTLSKTKNYTCSDEQFRIYYDSSELILFELSRSVYFIEKLLPKSNLKPETEEEPIPFLSLDVVGHKIVLLEKLGIIGFLREKHKTIKKQADFAALICLILGLPKAESENVRKYISYLDRKHKNNPNNETSLKMVKSQLLKIGIEI